MAYENGYPLNFNIIHIFAYGGGYCDQLYTKW